jgi:hypothetical protein
MTLPLLATMLLCLCIITMQSFALLQGRRCENRRRIPQLDWQKTLRANNMNQNAITRIIPLRSPFSWGI